MTTRTGPYRDRRGFTLIELLVCTVIIGILGAILLPAVMQAREAGRKMNCANNLKEVGLALLNYCGTRGKLPPLAPGQSNTPWTISIGPELEHPEIFELFDHSGDVYDVPVNLQLGRTEIPVYRCPSDVSLPILGTDWIAGNYASSPLLLGSPLSKCRDGTSHTALGCELTSDFGAGWITGPAVVLTAEWGSTTMPAVMFSWAMAPCDMLARASPNSSSMPRTLRTAVSP